MASARQKKLQAAAQSLHETQTNVLAVYERNREIEELPPGLETGHTNRRKRGVRTDEDCINEVCELISRGITATASVRFVGVPWATWQAWLKKNHEQARDKYEFAYSCHLEVMADNTLRIFEQLKAERDAALKAYNEAHRVWREWKPPAKEPKTPRPPEPIYEGPTDLDVRLASERVKARQWHLERRHEKFRAKHSVEQTAPVSILQEINIREAKTPEEAMRAYAKLINARPD
jgi:hypothetical protein